MQNLARYNLPDRAVCLFDETKVVDALSQMAEAINGDYKNPSVPIVVMPIMTGATYCSGILLPKLCFKLELDYVHATRYQNNGAADVIEWLHKPQINLNGRDVLLIDDILDHGVTLKAVVAYCYAQGATRVRTAVMLKKQGPTQVLAVDYWALCVEDFFVYGCGMDDAGLYRNAPGIFYTQQ